jgi:hypothetical protein
MTFDASSTVTAQAVAPVARGRRHQRLLMAQAAVQRQLLAMQQTKMRSRRWT